MTFLSGILSRACVEFCSEVFSASWLLGRLCDRNLPAVSSLHLAPPLLIDVAGKLAKVQSCDPDGYPDVLKGIRSLNVLASGGSTVMPRQRVIWQELLGKPLVVGYGMTENFGVVAITDYSKRGEYPMVSDGPRVFYFVGVLYNG